MNPVRPGPLRLAPSKTMGLLCSALCAVVLLTACATPTEPLIHRVTVEVTREAPVDSARAVATGAETPGQAPVEVVREVPVEVTRIVPREVEVTRIAPKEVVREVIREVLVTPTPRARPTRRPTATPLPTRAPTPVPTEKDTIIFSDLQWTSAQVQTRIAQYIVEKGYGYSTNLLSGASLPSLQRLRAGETHVIMENWVVNQGVIVWEQAIELGQVVSTGKTLVGGEWQSTFVIPAYVAKAHPGLRTPQDLIKAEYQDLFATADSRGKARLVSCLRGWLCEPINDAKIEAYGLSDSLHVIKPDSQHALFSEIFAAYEKKEPWLGYMWGTGDPALLLDLYRLEEPAYTGECWNSDKACAFDNSLVLVAIHKDLLTRAPDVIGFLQEWEFMIDIYKGIFRWIDANPDSTPAEAAMEWLRTSGDIWSGWLTADAAAKVKAALAAGEEADGWPDT